MKTLLPLLALLVAVASQAQKGNLQIGAITSFLGRNVLGENENALGGELIANISIQKNLSIGPGVQLLKFNDEYNLYVPVFTTFKLDLPADKLVYFLHADAGYGIHSFKSSFIDSSGNGVFKFDFKNTGGLYVAAGAGIKLKGKFVPYVNVQYSLYAFKFVQQLRDLSETKEYVYVNRNTAKAVTITAGFSLNKKHIK